MKMLKVFLVEDETIIREGLRDIIPWQQYGFTVVGDAGDGEQALPMIRETRPDVLITDIRMPFMDGLALSSLVSREFPNTKIIIISGYDEFEYARQAIRIGVEQYLLKPVTKAMLIKTLNEVQAKISSEREQESYKERFRSEVQEYEQFSRRRFFEEIVTGQLSVEEIYEKADQLGIAIEAQSYRILMYSIVARHRQPGGDTVAGYPKLRREDETGRKLSGADQAAGSALQEDAAARLQDTHDGLAQFFLMYPEYLVFRWNLQTYAVLIKAEWGQMDERTEKCLDTIRMHVLPVENEVEWHVAVGRETTRLSALPACFEEVSRIYSCRHLLGDCHVLTKENTLDLMESENEESLKNVDMDRLDPSILRRFLENGQPEEIGNFVDEYISGTHDAVLSRLFCQYLMLNVRFTAISFLERLGYDQKEFIDDFPTAQVAARSLTRAELKEYVRQILVRTFELRERKNRSQNKTAISQALEYIDQNYADENMSLKEVAGYVNVSANYFSAVFSQEMRQTFVEYLTQKRMERAKELLRTSDLRSAEVAAEVGYRDPHYFSFVFRKTQGCAPRDYRAMSGSGVKRHQ
ncbi:MAG: response regulator [Lachnospiraceae bacterium]|nr:response regulator [Lachnospiraceae bacterium]